MQPQAAHTMEAQVAQQETGKTLHQIPDEQHAGRAPRRRPSGSAAPASVGAGAPEQQQQQQQQQYSQLIGAIDQGTSSTRFLVFEGGSGRLVASSQLEIKRITPREGWVEIEPNSIMSSVYATMANVHDQLLAKRHQLNLEPAVAAAAAAANATDQLLFGDGSSASSAGFVDQKCAPNGPLLGLLKCIGICNQRESAVVWDAKTGRPLYNVIVWMDNRTKDIVDQMIDSIPNRDFNHLKDKTGLPMSTYFSAFKLRWLIDNVPEVRAALREKRLLFGTVDSWILWNLTGKHLTDVTNASRTFLMDIETLQWDKKLCKQFGVPLEILPKILPSAEHFGALQFGPFMGTPVTGVIGDQSAALFGHNCLQLGQTKATFGTGCFIMQNIGPGPLNGAMSGVQRGAKRGLITTVGYKLGDRPVCYALEGSVKIAGAALTWLRDNMQLIQNYEECDQLVNTTTNSAGVFFVPALGGLYSPYWDPNAAGLFIGLSQFTRREHLVRATFDSIAFQTNDILTLMRGVTSGLMIDGGLCKSDNLCQILADITGCDINRPAMCETSALGAAMVAGCGAGIWDYDSMVAQSNRAHEHSWPSNQTHHYPHESLNYDENKFARHSLPHRSVENSFKGPSCAPNQEAQRTAPAPATKGARTKTRGAGAAANNGSNNDNGHQQEPQQRQQQAATAATTTKHLRRPLRHRSGGRLMRNLDAGGGINDDAGGGGGGDGSVATLVQNTIKPTVPSFSDDDDDDDDDDDEASSGAHPAGSDTDLAAGPTLPFVPESRLSAIGSSYEEEESSQADLGSPETLAVLEIPETPETPTTSAPTPSASPATASPATTTSRALSSLMSNLHLNQGAPSSSGYSSGDNFESACASCQLTDSMRLSERRADSPGSQATASDPRSGRDSAAACTEDLASSLGQPACRQPSVEAGDSPPQSEASATFPFRVNLNTAYSASTRCPDGLSGSERTVAPTAAPVVQQVNNRKFVEKAECVADEVHEFGGRDSYGEDGYDSSTVSFDSYDDDDDDDEDDHLQDKRHDRHGTELAHYSDDEGQLGRDSENENQNSSENDVGDNGTDLDRRDVISSGHHQHHHQHHRRRRPSVARKQMDIFQPYISLEHRTELVDTWRLAVTRSMQWTKVHHEEIRRIDYQRLSSLPISMYVFFSIGLVALSGCLSPGSLLSQ